MKKTLLSAAILAATMSTAVYASESETGQAIDKYNEDGSNGVLTQLAGAADMAVGLDASGQYAPGVDNRVATVVAIPQALASIPNESCGQDCLVAAGEVLTTAAGFVVSGEDSTPTPVEPEPSVVQPESKDEAPLNITGTIAAADDACSVNMPASVDFSFDISRAEVDTAEAAGDLTFASEETVQIDFICGTDRQESDPLTVSFSTTDGGTENTDKVSAAFTSSYHTDNGAAKTLTATIQYAGGGDVKANKTLTNEASQNVSLQAAIALSAEQAKGGSFETSGTTLYVYLD